MKTNNARHGKPAPAWGMRDMAVRRKADAAKKSRAPLNLSGSCRVTEQRMARQLQAEWKRVSKGYEGRRRSGTGRAGPAGEAN